MKISTDRDKILFYSWAGIIYLLFFLAIAYFNARQTFLPRSINTLWRTVYLVLINFAFFEYAIPYINISRKRILYLLLAIVTMLLLCTFGWYAFRRIGIFLYIYSSFIHYPTALTGVAFQSVYGLFSIFFFGLTRHIYYLNKSRKAAFQFIIEKQQEELNHLKSQTSPHFLLNALNTIYSLTKEKSDLAPESILRLSKILRLMLYETIDNYISMEQEWKIVIDYIAIEKLRYSDSLNITTSYNLQHSKHQLPPLLLLPLVQNAFKHGVSKTIASPFLDVSLSVNEQQHMTFVVRNSIGDMSGSADSKKNMGLPNLRRQLELLYTDYDLTLQKKDSEFTATLKINLASHIKN